MKMINKCRVCGNEFFKAPLLRYKNMPKAAQFLPEAKTLNNDKGIDLNIFQCSSCGLIQLNRQPVSYYKQVIRAADISKEMINFRMKQFSRFVQKYSLKGKKIIEIGCGKGEYLSIMRQFDTAVYGLEYSAKAAAQCVRNGLKVSRGFIRNKTYKLNNAPFDAFFILNFFEHLPHPNNFLRGINNNLVDGAIGLIEVPNFDMILQKNLFSEFTSDHLFYFTKETLNTALNLNGFEIVESNAVWHNYIISAVVRKRQKLDISHFYSHQAKIKDDVENYIKRFKNKSVAIWGAGHQALAVISLINLRDKIKYVVDSAPFKQNKFTPATHIPIVSPETLNSNHVDAIIVMAASYSNEVAGIIRKRFGKNISISILRDYGLEEY